ncbi:MAG: hypothetical protein HKN76_08760 [Saprospiraceae bacterium]|nr:hypothetical protein [Saprospiraceae bacterium]
MNHYIFTSLTRISDLADKAFEYKYLAKANWATGDYIVCEVTKSSRQLQAELANGRMMELLPGDRLVAALGVRHASLEATGSWHAVGREGKMHLLTGAGLAGKVTSRSTFIPELIRIDYVGHVMIDQQKCRMSDYAPKIKELDFNLPVILIVGTSMSAGKTMAAKVIIRQLKKMNLKVVGGKLTGGGRYRDILSMKDGGADAVFDFVDAGLPSSICSVEQYSEALGKLLSMLASVKADVAVIEIGASPLEPYNGDIAVKKIQDQVKCTVLCASDPYAVVGVMQSWRVQPSIISGPAVNTLGGIDLIKKLCDIEPLNLIERENLPRLRTILRESLQLD